MKPAISPIFSSRPNRMNFTMQRLALRISRTYFNGVRLRRVGPSANSSKRGDLSIQQGKTGRANMTSSSRRGWISLGVGGTVMVGMIWLIVKKEKSVTINDPRDAKALSQVPLRKLYTGWIAFAFCSSPKWVEVSESLYKTLSAIPVVASITKQIVMWTFFDQFLGGETAEECVPKIETLRAQQIGTLLGYNIEAELDGSSKHPQLILDQTQHVLSSINAQAHLGKRFWPDTSRTGGDNRSWVRIKITGLVPHPAALYRGSNAILAARKAKHLDLDVPHPGLPHDGDWEAALSGPGVTEADREQLLALRATLEAIASKARDNNLRIVIDAEQSWYQPVIDTLTDELMQRYNRLDGHPTCIASFQAYLRRYPQLLDQQIKRAEEKGYKLLFKQVRGAYMVTEAKRWAKEGRLGPGPVWSTKEETDASYNYGIEKTFATMADQIHKTGRSNIFAVFATHNSIGVDLGIRQLEKYNFVTGKDANGRWMISKEVASSFAFAQLYGMKDDLTNKITGSIATEGNFPLVVKSMSYGELRECLPFLARRATENKAVLEGRGGAVAERIRLGREIRRRILPFTSGPTV